MLLCLAAPRIRCRFLSIFDQFRRVTRAHCSAVSANYQRKPENSSIKTFIKRIYSYPCRPAVPEHSVSLRAALAAPRVCTPSNQRLKILKIHPNEKHSRFHSIQCVLYLIASSPAARLAGCRPFIFYRQSSGHRLLVRR